MTYKVAQVVVGLPVEGPFDYFIEDSLQDKITIGARVLVPFGQRKLIGFVVGLKKASRFKKLKPILSLIDLAPILDTPLLKLTKEFSRYYGCAWGEAIETSLPTALRKGKTINASLSDKEDKVPKEAVEFILLHDKTKNKRWSFLMESIEKTLKEERGVIFLVPEISSIENIQEKLKDKFSDEIVILDKRLTPKKELENWLSLKEGKAKIVIGSRSAIFAPVKNLGLIIVYDEDHSAYKQEQAPFYHIRQVVFMRSKVLSGQVIFVSSTPSAEIWWLAKEKKIRYISCEADRVCEIRVVDVSYDQWRKVSILSFPLRSSIQKTLEKGGKAILFMNRKGFSTLTRCNQCGYTLKCKRCDSNLMYLFRQKKMICRHCNYTALPPSVCPQCQGSYLRFTGMGIEKLESEVSRLFPQARVNHYDKETKVLAKDFDILIATQAVLKFEEKLSVALVGVIRIDSELNRLDFHSAQKTFSLLIRLSHLAEERLIIQTAIPDNYCIRAVSKMDFKRFYREEIKSRRETGLPPFQHMIAVSIRGLNENMIFEQSNNLCQQIQARSKRNEIEVSEPYPDMMPKLRDKYRFNIFIKGKSVERMLFFIQETLKSFKRKSGMIISVNVDP